MRLASRVAVTLTLASLLAVPVIQHVAFAAEAGSAGKPNDNVQNQQHILPVTKQQDIEAEDKVDSRIGRLINFANQEKFSGRLTNEEADNSLSALNQVSESEAEFMALAGKLAPATELSLQLALDSLEHAMSVSMHDRKVASFDLLGREVLMQHRLDAAETDGRLSKADADYLRDQLSAIMKQQQGSSSTLGKVNYGDALVTSLHLDKLAVEYGKRLRRRPFAVPDVQALDSEVEQLQKKESDAGMQRVRLLSLQLNHPLPDKLDLKTPKTMGSEAAVMRAAQLEWLKALLEEDLSGKLTAADPGDQERGVDHYIAQSLDDGRLSPVEAQGLQSDLEAIIAQHQSYAKDGNQLSAEQRGQLALALSRLEERVAQTGHAPTRFWAGIDAVQTALDERIADAAKAGRLTADQVKELKDAANSIADSEANYRKQDGGLSGKDALLVAELLEQLNVKLHQELKDRVTGAPDLDKLQATLSKTISDSVEMGKLDYHSRLADKLNHITDLKQAYAAAPGGLDDRAKLAVGQAIMHNLVELKGAIHHDETVPAQTLDMRISQLTQDISAAVASGVLAPGRAAQYKAAVDTVYGQLLEARKNQGGMTPAQSLAVANDIDSLRDQFDDEQRDAATLPMHLAPRIKDLAGRIGRALADGRLPLSQASELISQLDHGAERLASAASTQGGLSHGEGLLLAFHLEKLSNDLESDLHDQPVTVVEPQQKAQNADRKLASALAAGKISVNEAQHLHNAFQEVASDAQAFQKSDNHLSYPEEIALGLEWDQLGKMIDKSNVDGGKWTDLSSRRNGLEKRVKDAIAVGRINQKDGQQLIEDLDRAAQSEASFRMSDERLDYAEALTLTLELDRVSSRVDGLLKGQLSLKQKH